jgi:hypothetical protein
MQNLVQERAKVNFLLTPRGEISRLRRGALKKNNKLG